MYKDKDQQREAVKRAVQKHRGITPGITSEGITPQGMTRIEFIQQELNDPLVLYGIERAALLFDDRDVRYESAYRYHLWQIARLCNTLDKSMSTSYARGQV